MHKESDNTQREAIVGDYDENEKLVDDVVATLYSLYVACQRDGIPAWANDLLEKLKNGSLLTAVEKLLEGIYDT